MVISLFDKDIAGTMVIIRLFPTAIKIIKKELIIISIEHVLQKLKLTTHNNGKRQRNKIIEQ
jgi:hypothetical protein